MMKFNKEKLPIYPRSSDSGAKRYPVVFIAHIFSYLLRLVSPGAWIMAFCQDEGESADKTYTNPYASEWYQIGCTIFPLVIFFIPCAVTWCPTLFLLLCTFILVEAIQYQFGNLILRPHAQAKYVIYSASRTLLIVLMQYVQFIFVFAIYYRYWLYVDIEAIKKLTDLHAQGWASLELSLVTITTLGFGDIAPNPGTISGVICALEAFIGVLFFGIMVASAITRMRPVQEVGGANDAK